MTAVAPGDDVTSLTGALSCCPISEGSAHVDAADDIVQSVLDEILDHVTGDGSHPVVL